MNQPEGEHPSPSMGPARPHELNGTFLVRPAPAWTHRDSIRGLAEVLLFQMQGGPVSEGEAWVGLELVLDGANLLPFHFLRTGDRMGRAVVKIQRIDGATGTGFLVAPDILLTNHHVLPDHATALTAVAMANYEVSPPNDAAGRAAVSQIDPTSLFVTNADLDFTFCGVQGLDFLGAVPLDRERMHVEADQTVTIIQHPRGRPKEIALRENRVVHADGVVIQYSCDTEPGSSGSPVFNDQWKPVAIHHASVLTDSPEGRRIAPDSRDRFLNEGIRLSAIALWLDTAEVETPEHRDHVDRLRALFGGLDRRAGFFGALGRRSHGRPANEVVADSYGDRVEVLDLGYWDTIALAGAPGGLRSLAADVGRVIADMGLDVWCLTQAEAVDLDAICEHLWAAYRLSYQAISIGPLLPSGLASGVLVRSSKTLVAEPLAAEPGRFPARVRLRTRLRRGSAAELVLVPLIGSPSHETGLFDLAQSVCRHEAAQGPDWIFVGDHDLVLALLADSGDILVAAANPRDGAVVFVSGRSSTVSQVFVSQNLHPTLDLTGRLTIAHNRTLPASARSFTGPLPFALRVSLDAAETAPLPEPPPRPPLVPTALSPAHSGLDALIEQKIRDILTPVVAKIVADARGQPEG
jgi:hypothetical protein